MLILQRFGREAPTGRHLSSPSVTCPAVADRRRRERSGTLGIESLKSYVLKGQHKLLIAGFVPSGL